MTPVQEQFLNDGRKAIATLKTEVESLKIQLADKELELSSKIAEIERKFRAL